VFDIGISEIMIIAVVALIVLGPEKLPRTARTLGHLFGRLQRYVADVKADINRELALEELKKMQAEVKSAATDIEHSMSAAASEIQSSARAIEADLDATAAAVAPPAPAGAPAPSAPAGPAGPAGDAPRQASLPGFDRG
jgi:sec-independent protein translocase protein TatB